MESPDVIEWRSAVAGRMKVKQILETFSDVLDKPINKFVCTPCVSCQIQINGLLDYYGLREKYHIYCGGLLDLVLNIMIEVKNPPSLFIKPPNSNELELFATLPRKSQSQNPQGGIIHDLKVIR